MNKKNALYHISEFKNIEMLIPSIPSNYLTDKGYEDNTTPRVCVARSINECIIGKGDLKVNTKLYVYSPTEKYEIYRPSEKEVPDCSVTGELWIKEYVLVKCIGIIEVTKEVDRLKVINDKLRNIDNYYRWISKL